MKRNIVIPAAVTAVLLLVISGVRESRYTYETQPGGCVQVQGGGFAGRQYPGGMSMGTGTGGGLLFWVDQGGPELELTAEFPDRAVRAARTERRCSSRPTRTIIRSGWMCLLR